MIPSETHSLFRAYLPFIMGVVLAHAALLYAAYLSPPALPKPKLPQTLVVRSVALKPIEVQPQIKEPPATIAMETEIKPVVEPQPIITEAPLSQPLPPEPDFKPLTEIVEKPKLPEPKKESPKPVPKPQPKVEKKEIKKNPPKPAEKPVAKPKETPKKALPKKETKPIPKKETKPEVKRDPPKNSEPPKIEKPQEVPKKPTAEEIAAQKAAEAQRQEQLIRQQEQQARQKELIAQAQQSLAKVGEAREKGSAVKAQVSGQSSLDKTALPKTISSLQIEALPQMTSDGGTLTIGEVNYRDEVAARLKMALKLPDYGEVKINLTLARSGKVESVKVLSSESIKNRQYVEKTLPTMTFLPFGKRFEGASIYSFVIVLKNS